jgi:hypothetical protein
VKVWSARDADDGEQVERHDICRNRIIWERLNPAADWFFCHMSGKRIETVEVVPHGNRVLIRRRDEVDPHWWHRAMTEMKKESDVKFTPPAHWIEDEDEDEDVDQEVERLVETELRSQVSILRSHCV